ncbi:2489_t:CDS:2 [Funneliformis mosseae]|uniref:2489_t:CDS:1 n=1 Tax=Funneliformis mosseae TaxID=27381 RepID=A0A9N8VVD6_FUNMO|nr:2489_t:CDS:2 [Funneliformis mosseae]
MTSKFHAELSQELLLMLNSADDHNVVIQVGKDQNIKEFRAHSNILRARSPYFKSAFSSGWATKNNNIIEFKKPNINPKVFEMILNYIYAGEVDLTKQSVGKVQIESKIIKPKLASIIINWMNRKDAKAIRSKEDLLYKFNLIYRGSRDGIDNNSFRSNYNSQVPTLVLVKCQGSQKIFGGYSPIKFYNYDYGDQFTGSIDCFIFSFENNEDTQNMKLSRVNSQYYNYAIYEYYAYDDSYGFNFGCDFYTQGQCLYVNMNTGYYENNVFNNNNAYTIEEIEAFNITNTRK